MINLSVMILFFLSVAFFSLPSHMNPASLGVMILIIVISMLTYFISLNMTLLAIFIVLVYISGILILFSYFFSLIQNTKIFFTPLLFTIFFLSGFVFFILIKNSSNLISKITFLSQSYLNSFLWILSDVKLVFFLVIILLLSMLFIEKVIGLKQKPLRVK